MNRQEGTANSRPDPESALVVAWIDALVERHTREFTRPEFLKSVRALSARYVEKRADLSTRSALDSAGKRAAFAAFYAPLHLLTVRAIVEALGPSLARPARLVDLGCGTGVASAGWALGAGIRPSVLGTDGSAWALGEATWNWRTLGLTGRTRRDDLVSASARLTMRGAEARPERSGIILGWAVNELNAPARDRLLETLRACAGQGAQVLIVEPIARTLTPWWNAWCERLAEYGATSQDWKLPVALPSRLSQIDHEAGFHRESLSARTLWCPGASLPAATDT